MRKQFINGTLEFAKEECPWAAKIVRVKGGYMCFESVADYYTWNHQE